MQSVHTIWKQVNLYPQGYLYPVRNKIELCVFPHFFGQLWILPRANLAGASLGETLTPGMRMGSLWMLSFLIRGIGNESFWRG